MLHLGYHKNSTWFVRHFSRSQHLEEKHACCYQVANRSIRIGIRNARVRYTLLASTRKSESIVTITRLVLRAKARAALDPTSLIGLPPER